MSEPLVCWRCGASLAQFTLPLRRREECPGCRAELHVCRMCEAWEPRRARQCRQEDAEEVRNKEQANFCDYFRPRPGAFDTKGAAAEQQSRDQLATLFGTGGTSPDTATQSAADVLFRSKPKQDR